MFKTIKKMFAENSVRTLDEYKTLVDEVNALESHYETFTDEQLKAETLVLREALSENNTIESIQTRAFALVREASKRVLGMRHYDVQLLGGFALLHGNIAQMPTGEGKTLVASLPSFTRALEGKGVHVITVNDYLARRDAAQIGQIHKFLGLSLGLNLPQMEPDEKREAYAADITYGVGTEFGFDYLRDNMTHDVAERVQRPYHFAIIDEIDSVLIDEAKTPLIISGMKGGGTDLYSICARFIRLLARETHYTVDEEMRAASFTDQGVAAVEEAFAIDNLFAMENATLYHFVIQALRAHALFKRDVDYIVDDEDKIQLVDLFTGRVMEGRSLSNGLHQAIEAKEGVPVTDENATMASITIQNYFRMYPILSGMTGTAKAASDEFRKVYMMDVIEVPTNRPVIRQDLADRVFLTAEAKYEAVCAEVRARQATGQPVLVGTTSILQSERLSNLMKKHGIKHELLNAKTVEQEIELIQGAGQRGRVTIATNMAGRGTDILLGEGVPELGGLFVLGTERHESIRIDQQLRGRSGRQGDPGCSQFFISIQDELFIRFAEEKLKDDWKRPKVNEAYEIIEPRVHDFARSTQEACESAHESVRTYQLKMDNVIQEHRRVFYHMRDQFLEHKFTSSNIHDMMDRAMNMMFEKHLLHPTDPEMWNILGLQEELRTLFPLVTIDNVEWDDDTHIRDAVAPFIEEAKTLLTTVDEVQELHDYCAQMTVYAIDFHWIQHLEYMESVREGIGLKSYGQEDPVLAFEKEGLASFNYTYGQISLDVIGRVLRSFVQPDTEGDVLDEESILELAD
ncbi:MAG: accessory Sec system translocase SecA2 [Bacilli bacterium]